MNDDSLKMSAFMQTVNKWNETGVEQIDENTTLNVERNSSSMDIFLKKVYGAPVPLLSFNFLSEFDKEMKGFVKGLNVYWGYDKENSDWLLQLLDELLNNWLHQLKEFDLIADDFQLNIKDVNDELYNLLIRNNECILTKTMEHLSYYRFNDDITLCVNKKKIIKAEEAFRKQCIFFKAVDEYRKNENVYVWEMPKAYDEKTIYRDIIFKFQQFGRLIILGLSCFGYYIRIPSLNMDESVQSTAFESEEVFLNYIRNKMGENELLLIMEGIDAQEIFRPVFQKSVNKGEAEFFLKSTEKFLKKKYMDNECYFLTHFIKKSVQIHYLQVNGSSLKSSIEYNLEVVEVMFQAESLYYVLFDYVEDYKEKTETYVLNESNVKQKLSELLKIMLRVSQFYTSI